MIDFINPIALPTTSQELDEAVRAFKANSDWSGEELFQHWEAIRQATLNLSGDELDSVSGGDSY
jgi:hypothetical protein